MTYQDLLKETAKRKRLAIRELNNALKGSFGFLVKAEIEKDPGKIAWQYLAKEFCETLADHVTELVENTGDADGYEASEICDIYMAYEDRDDRLYDLLPVEARLF